MPGLKALTDRVEGPRVSRYQSLYTATFSVGTSLSLLQAGLVGDWLGWRAAFAAAGIAPLLAAALVAWRLRPLPPPRRRARRPERLFDFRPVLRNREAIGYVLGYGAHCWELFGFRTWLVAFMAFAAAGSVGDSTISLWATRDPDARPAGQRLRQRAREPLRPAPHADGLHAALGRARRRASASAPRCRSGSRSRCWRSTARP